MYEIVHVAYCGMVIPRGEYDDSKDGRSRLRRIAKHYGERYGCEITWSGPNTIEIGEPENCVMIPDFCGITSLRKIKKS